MKKTSLLAILKNKTAKTATAGMAMLVSAHASAQAGGGGGLSKAKGVLESFQDELTDIIPIVAIIALAILGIGYATKFVEKDTFFRWAVGIIVAGSAAQLTALFFT